MVEESWKIILNFTTIFAQILTDLVEVSSELISKNNLTSWKTVGQAVFTLYAKMNGIFTHIHCK